MEHNFKRFLFGLMFMLIAVSALAQGQLKLPIDPEVRYGKLENGLTYYIRHNEYPKNQADFYIAQKVGSMQEEDSQQGLAHFLEHMAFNGTVNFPGRKNMLDYLEKNGVQFGSNVNAYTSFDETVYNITNVPMSRPGMLDSCLLILHDWSGYISLQDDEIDKERKIIKEEWRSRSGAGSRIWEKLLPVVFENSKYANRMPIGTMDIVENFDYQEIKDYYKKWYRPDLQGIIIVGDFDAAEVENKVKALFSEIPMPKDAAERVYYTVEDNKEPIVAIAIDPEQTSTSISLFFKHDVMDKNLKQSAEGMYVSVLDMITSQVLSERYSEIAQKADAPFLGAGFSNGYFLVSKNKMAWTVSAACKEGEIDQALQALVRETERVKKFGFLESEVERAKQGVLQMYENSFNNKDKQRSNAYAQEYVSSFINNEPIPGIEVEFELLKQMLPTINAEVLNAYMNSLNLTDNLTIVVMGPEKENLKYPLPQELQASIEKVKGEELIAYTEELSDEPLVTNLPAKGKITDRKDSLFDTKTWTLSSGVKVILKKTDFKDDQILMVSTSFGGTSLFDDKDSFNASLVSAVPSLGGLGDFNNVDLGKKLAGKSVSASPYVGVNAQGVNMSSNIRDLETAMQLVYLTYTAPRKDDEAYNAYMTRLGSYLQNADLQPNTAFRDSVNTAMFGNNPRTKAMKLDDMASLNYDRILEMYKECFEQGTPNVFTFVGTIDEETLAPLVEQYLASLPVVNKDRMYVDRDTKVKTGRKVVHFDKKMETPKTSVFNLYSGTLDYNQQNQIKLNALNQILDLVFTRTIREDEGGTYGVGSNISMSRIPLGQTNFTISYTTDSAKVDNLNKIAFKEISRIVDEGPEIEDFNKVIEFMKKNHTDRVKTNNYWLSIIDTNAVYGDDNYTSYLDYVDALTPDDIRKIAADLIKQENYIEVIMYPE